MSEPQMLPPPSNLSLSAISYLNDKLHDEQSLSQSKNLVSDVEDQGSKLESDLVELNSRLEASLVAYASFSDRIYGLLGDVDAKLTRIGLETSVSDSQSDGGKKRIWGVELPALAKEVARVETVRAYAETALKLDSLIGSVEEAVSSTLSKTLRKPSSVQSSEEVRRNAIKTLEQIEDVVSQVTRIRPHWSNMVSAVDNRVDRALAVLRPQAIADHRALLASLGWPPPLSALSSSNPDAGKSASAPNPLFTMQGDLKHQYCENFLSLCHLQELQRKRKSRQLEGHNREIALQQPLWAIEELVNPISLASERHFKKWVDRPEFIFALVYKVTRDYLDSMDELLQPLVDEAMLAGYSCREEWIASMVSALSTYLAKEIFPNYASQLGEENDAHFRAQARTSWLHLIDLMVAFDKRIRSLIANSGISFSLMDEGNIQKFSSLSVFCDRPDWLEVWAEIEFSDSLDKFKTLVDDERNWMKKIQEATLISGAEDYRSPIISDTFLRRISSVIDRAQSLPAVPLRSKFLRLVGAPTIQKFLDCLLLRCQEAEGLTALTEDDALMKVTNSINASHYFESVLKEWCEDVFFIEMELGQCDKVGLFATNQAVLEASGSGIFDEELRKLENFRVEWVEKLSVVILRGFEALSREYLKNRKQWQEKGEEGWNVSKSLVGALDYLQGKLSVIEVSLNLMDFSGLWRNLAEGIDKLVCNCLLLGPVKFYDAGVARLSNDMEVLFAVFQAWCLRPEGFFPKVNEGLKLLKMKEHQLKHIVKRGEMVLREQGIRHLSFVEAEKIAKNRVFTN